MPTSMSANKGSVWDCLMIYIHILDAKSGFVLESGLSEMLPCASVHKILLLAMVVYRYK